MSTWQAKGERGLLAIATVALLISALANVALVPKPPPYSRCHVSAQLTGGTSSLVPVPVWRSTGGHRHLLLGQEEGRAGAKVVVGGTLLKMCGVIVVKCGLIHTHWTIFVAWGGGLEGAVTSFSTAVEVNALGLNFVSPNYATLSIVVTDVRNNSYRAMHAVPRSARVRTITF